MAWLLGVTSFARRMAGCWTSLKRLPKRQGWPAELRTWVEKTPLHFVGAGTLLPMLLLTSMAAVLLLIRPWSLIPTWQQPGTLADGSEFFLVSISRRSTASNAHCV